MTIIQDFKKSLYDRVSRRKFIAIVGALGIGGVLGMIYTSIRLRKSIHPLSKQPEKSRVYVVSANDREVWINNLLDSFSILDFKYKSIILKPNFNSDDPFPASTHIDTLRLVIKKFKEIFGYETLYWQFAT